MSRFPEGKIGDLLTLQRGFDITKKEQTDGPIPVISSGGIASYHNMSMVKGPGVVIGRKGTLGTVFYVKSDYWPHDTTLWVKDFKGNCVEFIYYFLKALPLEKLDSGSTNPTLNRNIVHQLKAPLPTLHEQRKIAEILSVLDAKIELNNQVNEELAGMVKFLYEYWFVQFDFPMTAAQAAALGKPKLVGHPYRASGGKMSFCPELNRFIPEGWKVGDLSDLCSTVRGVTYSKPDVRASTDENVIPILRATNVNNGIIDLGNLVFVTDEVASEDQFLNKFDILIVMSSGSKAHVGKNALYHHQRKVAFGAFCSKIVPKKGCRFFVSIHLQTDAFKKYISNVCLGTNINNLTNGHVTGHRLVIPAENPLEDFENMVECFFETTSCNLQQNQELTELRDWLLPMLMNGQVTVG